jgi:gliding motility-associated-like protein
VRILVTIFIFLTSGTLLSQLTTSTAQSPGVLVQNVLLGPGVIVSNISYSGKASAIGSFNGANTNLGLNEGIVMTTGTVINNGNGPHGPNTSDGSGTDNGQGGFSLLSNLIGGTETFNAAILEFDFVPQSDIVSFRYVFGSEEYPEFVNSSYNDVFAFFISGPGISGNKNMALVPGSGSAVAINNINNGGTNTGPCVNCAYYINNGNGKTSPNDGSPYYIQYDGFTKVLTATSSVQCGKKYHLIIAIADAGDGIYDSGIFLEANSLTSKLPIQVGYSISKQAFSDPDVMAEGCVTATFVLQRGAGDIDNSLTLPINVSGTATEGVDYGDIPNSITFAPGETVKSFTFSAFNDVITEGLETIFLNFPIVDPCGNDVPVDIELGINDVEPVSVTVESSSVLCPGQPLEMIAYPLGGVSPYTYLWNTGATTKSIFVSPTSSETFTVQVTDDCLRQTATASGTVTVPVYLPITLDKSDDLVDVCPYVPQIIEVFPSGGSGVYTFQWSASNGQILGKNKTEEVLPSETTSYTVVVTDQCGTSNSITVLYTITSPPLVLEMAPKQRICLEDSAFIWVKPTGGYGAYYYYWQQIDSNDSSVWVYPQSNTVYTVDVSDDCQTFTVQGQTAVQIVFPTADFEISSNTVFEKIPITFQNLSLNASTYWWDFGDGQESSIIHPNNTFEESGTYLVTLIAINDIGCRDTIAEYIRIGEEYYVYIPNSFTPDGDVNNNVFKVSLIGIKEFKIQIFNRWGELIFESDKTRFQWDGTFKGNDSPIGVYTYKVKYIPLEGEEVNIVGHINLIR